MLTCDLHVRGIHELAAIEEAVGGRDHVLGGHQRAAAAVVARAHQHHPGVLVSLSKIYLVNMWIPQAETIAYRVDLCPSNNSCGFLNSANTF